MTDENSALLRALEVIGQDSANRRLPGDLLRDEATVELLVSVEDLLWQPGSVLTAQAIRLRAPSFYEQFGAATLRELGAPFGHPREVAASAANG